MKLLLDEDSQAKVLITLLRSAGHDVWTVGEEGISGQDDASVLSYAHKNGRVLLTRNPSDFLELHNANSNHLGIIAVYQGNDPSKNMSYAEIVKAIDNLEKASQDLATSFIILNQWKY